MQGIYNCPLGGKLDVSLYQDRALFGPVNAVGVQAVLVEADPLHGGCPRIQFGVRTPVYPDALPPLRHTCEVRLLPSEPLKWCGGFTNCPG